MLLTLAPDGVLEVQEALVVRFGAPASTSFMRRLPRAGHDGITQVRAFVDDRLVSSEAGAERVRVDAAGPGGRGADVTWTFPAIASGTRMFRLRYRAAATLAVSGGHGRFAWAVLDPHHAWHVIDARVTLTVPPGADILGPAGVVEPGWRVSPRPDGGVAEKSPVAPGETATASVEISIPLRSLAEPTWQFEAERAEKLVPAFVIAAAFILVTGVGALVMIAVLSPKTRVDQERAMAAAGLRTAGGVLLLLGGALTWFVRSALYAFGPWAMAVPLSVVLVGLLFLIAGPRLRDR